MSNPDQAYVNLQRHLDQQPIGFPATRSGVEVELLKHIFTPREAEIAACLTHRFESLNTIYRRAGHLVSAPAALADILECIEGKGGIEIKIKNGTTHYANLPLVVGMYEYQLRRLTPEFIRAFDRYTGDINFGLEFLSSDLPQMRTIPISKSLTPQHQVSTFDEITGLMNRSQGPFTIFDCICRQKKALAGDPCQVTDRNETCMAIGDLADSVLRQGMGHRVDRTKALAVLKRNQHQGLVLQPSNTRRAEFICSCCGCCCGMLGVHQRLPKPLDFWAANFYVAVDQQLCNGCGICNKRCQVGAMRLTPNGNPIAEVDLKRCLGCGVCVPTCPTKAISLYKKASETRPPSTREELYEIIMQNKKSRWGKMKLAGKLVLDALKTQQMHLLS